jgi:5'-methylthioadenosine phosphorylase
MTVGVILGSSFAQPRLAGRALDHREVKTRFGPVSLYRHPDHDAWLLLRHGAPHRALPHQVAYRAHAAALKEVGCGAVLLTSSVGVLVEGVPLFVPLLVDDLLMLDNRLPDGSACTMWPEPSADQAHLIVDGGLFDPALSHQVSLLADDEGAAVGARVVFAYVPGPRTKTPAENRLVAQQGAQVNSMSIGPEVVLLNELEIPTAALVVGHKRSVPGARDPLDRDTIAESLERARAAMERIVEAFCARGRAVPFANRLYRFAAAKADAR